LFVIRDSREAYSRAGGTHHLGLSYLEDARLLEACGVTVPRQPNGKPVYLLEISPLYALGAEALKARLAKDGIYQISKDTLLV
jgi:hypothetical protein